MATDYISKKLSLHVAEQFNESFSEPEPTSIGYVFIGNHVPYSDENTVPTIAETNYTERQVWDNIFAAKRISSTDMNLVIPKKLWAISSVYSQYDDQVLYTGSDNFYVVTSQNKVYKCLYNNNGGPTSTDASQEPSVDYSLNNGIQKTSDGYIWKYMYAFDSTNKFVGDSYVPVPTSVSSSGYYMSSSAAIDGAIYAIKVTNAGSGYSTNTKTSVSFSNNVNKIQLASISGVANNMYVSGTGIVDGTYVTFADAITSNVTISKNTSTTVTGGTLSFSARAVITGDGMDATADVILSASNTISAIQMTNYGSGYSYANISVYGSGSGFSGRVIVPPKFGHGKYPAKELSANSVMISSKIGLVDTTEGGTISSSTSIRQYGFLRDPYLYGDTSPVNSFTAPSSVSHLYTVKVVTGSNYTQDEFVYQGAYANPTFSGYVNQQDTTTVSLSKKFGTLTIGNALIGNTSGTIRTVLSTYSNTTFQPYTGDILYVENISKLQRISGQTENFKFVISF